MAYSGFSYREPTDCRVSSLPETAMILDFSHHMTRLCRDMAHRLDELSHIDVPRIVVTASFNRKSSKDGVYASVTPLRFRGGSRVGKLHGQTMAMPLVCNAEGVEQLYILTFYLPRFLKTGFAEKLETVAHELWHISPDFDGTLREFEGRCRIHGPTKEAFDAQSRKLARDYLGQHPPDEVTAFLRASWSEIRRNYRRLRVWQIPRPQMRRFA